MSGIDSRIFFWVFKARLASRVKLAKKIQMPKRQEHSLGQLQVTLQLWPNK